MTDKNSLKDTKKPFSFLYEKVYSLRTKLILFILLGILAGGAAYLLLRVSLISFVNAYYVSPLKKQEREDAFLGDLQKYVTENAVTAADANKISDWARKNRYVYLALYNGEELLYASRGGTTGVHGLMGDGSGGITVDYPTREELVRYAEEKGFGIVTLTDGTSLYVSLAEFTEYLYYDLANIVSLVAGVLVITLVLMIYYSGIANRISRLADDVSIVSAGDMKHTVRSDDVQDELSKLSENVEQMRSSLIDTLDGERKVLEMNRDLITSMSHDIRTPLTVLLGYLDVMKLHTDKGSEMEKYIAASEATAVRLKNLSDDMFRYFLAFGNSELELHRAYYDADTLFSQMLAEHILLMRERGYTVNVTVTGEIFGNALVFVDAPFLMRIFDNIFSNFQKYADKDAPITFRGTLDSDNLYLHITNKIKENDHAESSRIGIRTCERIADAMKIGFSYEVADGLYTTCLSFPYTEEKGDDDIVL